MGSFLCCQARTVSSDLNESVELTRSEGAESPTQLEITTEHRASETLTVCEKTEPLQRLRPRSSSTSELERYTAKNRLEKDGPHASAQIISNPGSLDIADRAVPHSFPHGYHALLMKMEIIEQQRLVQHKEMMKVMKDILYNQVKENRGSRERLVSKASSMRSERSGELSLEVLTDNENFQHYQNCPVSSQILIKLSERVTRKWKFLGRRLGIEEHEIQQIKGDNQGDMQEQSYQMLLKWTQSNGGGSYQELGEAVKMTFGEKLYSDYVKMVMELEGKDNSVAN